MRRQLLCLALATMATLCQAQFLSQPIDLWPGMAPGITQEDTLQWNPRKDDGNRFTRVTHPTLEAFRPQAEQDNGQAIIVCPGGAYQILAYEKEGQEVAQWLARLGYTAYVLAYRVPDNREGALQDAFRAIRQARAMGASRVGIIGFSAGGSLSCRAATRWSETVYTPQDDADLQSQRPDFGILIYPAYLDEGEGHTLSPELTVTEQTCPLFVFGTEDDRLYSGPSSVTILQAMQQAGAPIELHYLTRGGHGYGMRRGAGLIWPALCEAWLRGLK